VSTAKEYNGVKYYDVKMVAAGVTLTVKALIEKYHDHDNEFELLPKVNKASVDSSEGVMSGANTVESNILLEYL
jgi:hypothetical protein